jgi:NitT/TauT family transport system substrate-binding protein
MAKNLQALRVGEIDAAQMFEPYVSIALQMAAGDIFYAASTRGPTSYTTFLATRESIQRNRPALAAMVRAIRRALAWLAEHSADELAEAVAPFYADTPREVLRSSLRRYRDAELWAHATAVSRQGFARLAESLRSGGFIARTASYEDCVDQSLD